MAFARRARLRAGYTLIVATAGLVGAVLPTQAGNAAPSLTVAQVQARIAALDVRAERLTEAYDAARGRVVTLQGQAATAGTRLAQDKAAFAAVTKSVAAQARLVYQTGGTGPLAAVLATGSAQQVIDQSMDLQAVATYEQSQLQNAAVAQRNVQQAQTTYGAAIAAERATANQIAAENNQILTLLAQEKGILAELKASDRARLDAAQSAAAAQQSSMRGHYDGPASGAAGAAVRFAYAQLGKPYVYGASGPGSYDCSGLTMRAWQAGGVYLPHNAAEQQADSRFVSRGDLQPGDLVFFGNPAYHVAIYVGGGDIIEAPHTGDVVKLVPLSYMNNYSGAGRP